MGKASCGPLQEPRAIPLPPQEAFSSQNSTPSEHRAYADELEKYETVLAVHKQAIAAYNKRTGDLEAEFQADLEAYYEMTGHPKAGLLYWKAYERGHSGGMEEVANAYSDLVELVK